MDSLNLKSTIPWIKNSLFLTAEKRVSEYIDRSIEIIQTNEKRMNKMEWIITELWETVNNLTYIYKVGISEGEKREVILKRYWWISVQNW